MKEKKCKHCGKKVKGDHYCLPLGRTVFYESTDDFTPSFLAGLTGDYTSGNADSGTGDCGPGDSSGGGGSDSGGCGGGGD
ncbi:hypothetical protein HY839_02770 [Candidatus Azambacteria bacterium]|nr:hypothetical protein [Candidatus Azambacteria bacterium]